jgi:anti-sigma B factor antagonist
MPANELSITLDGDRAVIRLHGEHESYSADRLARHLDSLLAEGLSIAVDLTTTEFIDSTVIGVLLAAHRRAQGRRLGFVLVLGERTGWPVHRVLDVTGLRSQFDVVGESTFR